MAQCRLCSHDLVSKLEHKGEVRCSNKRCKYADKAHPTGKDLNVGKA
jgi:hypothetical protein